MLDYLVLLNRFGVTKVNLRFIEENVLNEVVTTDDQGRKKAQKWIKKNRLDKQTIFCTFNQPFENVKSNKAFSDGDIKTRNFIMIDFDPVRPKNTSSTDNEKEKAFSKMEEVKSFLEAKGIKNIIISDSGNGYHLNIPLIPVPAAKTTELTGDFLKELSTMFNSDSVEIDLTVKNPSRLTKLYGCLATKGKDTEERPHRYSQIISSNITDELNDINLLESVFVTKHDKLNARSSNSFIMADAKKWLDYYKIGYEIKQGKVPGMTIYVIESCPLKVHSNSQRGSTLQETKDGKVRFGCLHASHESFDIHDFEKEYPLPEEAKLVNRILRFISDKTDYRIGNFHLKQNALYKMGKDKEVEVSPPIFISNYRRNQETNESQFLLNYKTGNTWLTKWITGESLMANEFKKLVKFSVIIPPRAEADMLDFLLKQSAELIVENYHQSIGWSNDSFFLGEEISYNKDTTSYLDGTSLFDLSSKGTYAEWHAMIENYVLGTNMELGLVIGFSSITIGKLSQKYPDLTTLFVSIEGDSTTGKSTSQLLMTSLFGSPSTLLDSWNSTQNAILSKVENNSGILYALDEFGANSTPNVTNLIYQLTTGKSRMRLNKDAKLREQYEFSTTIVSSSEISLKSKMSSFQGIDARIISFRDIEWTKDAKSSEMIKKISCENQGVAAKAFVSELFKKTEYSDFIVDEYERSKKELNDVYAPNALKGRLVAQYAIFLTTAKLIKELISIEINCDGIKRHLLESYKTAINISEYSDDLTPNEILTQIFFENQHKLICDKESIYHYGRFCGRYKKQKSTDQVKINIEKTLFEESMKRFFREDQVAYEIKKLVREGLLKAEDSRNTKRIVVQKTSFTTYEFYLDQSVIANTDLNNRNLEELNKQSKFHSDLINEEELF